MRNGILTVCMIGMNEQNGHAYIYMHYEKKGNKRGRIAPFEVECGCTNNIRQCISKFMESYKITKFTIHETNESVCVVQVHSGYPQKGDEPFSLVDSDEALRQFQNKNVLAGGTDEVEAIRTVIDGLQALLLVSK